MIERVLNKKRSKGCSPKSARAGKKPRTRLLSKTKNQQFPLRNQGKNGAAVAKSRKNPEEKKGADRNPVQRYRQGHQRKGGQRPGAPRPSRKAQEEKNKLLLQKRNSMDQGQRKWGCLFGSRVCEKHLKRLQPTPGPVPHRRPECEAAQKKKNGGRKKSHPARRTEPRGGNSAELQEQWPSRAGRGRYGNEGGGGRGIKNRMGKKETTPISPGTPRGIGKDHSLSAGDLRKSNWKILREGFWH